MGAGHVPVAWPALDFKIGDEGDMTMIATRCKDRQTMPQEQKICCFWGEDAINYLEALSLASFVAAGHPVTLYAYHPSGPTPKGVIVKDAADILPQDAAPASLLADLFRYHCLAQRPGVIWVAPDFVLIQPLRTEDGRLLAEQGGGYLSPDVRALPPDSMALRTILAFIAETRPIPPWATPEEQAQLAAMKDPEAAEDLSSGIWGAKALTYFAKKSGEAENALPKTAFYPLRYADRAILLTRKEKVENFTGALTAAIPLYGWEIARQLHEVEAGLPKYWCPLGALLRQFEVFPRTAPLFGVAPVADDKWAESTSTSVEPTTMTDTLASLIQPPPPMTSRLPLPAGKADRAKKVLMQSVNEIRCCLPDDNNINGLPLLSHVKGSGVAGSKSMGAGCASDEPHLANIGQVPVALGIVDAIANHEFIGDFKPDESRVHPNLPPCRFV